MEPQGVSDASQVLSAELIEREKRGEEAVCVCGGRGGESWRFMLLGSNAVESLWVFSVEISKQMQQWISK